MSPWYYAIVDFVLNVSSCAHNSVCMVNGGKAMTAI